MTRTALLTGALCLTLAACGGAASDTATTSSSTSATPSASAGPKVCPIKATTVPPAPGISADLAVKPVIAANPAPPPAEVKVADIVVGTGAEATTLSAVKAKYVGALYSTGVEFDSSWKTGPEQTIDFAVCATGTVPGFAIGPMGMKVGGRREVIIPSKFGYGAQAKGTDIPANSALVFVIDLVSATPPAG